MELRNYDLQHENYTRSLWVAEGITSYYEDLLLVRAGLMKQSAFVNGLSRRQALPAPEKKEVENAG